jgi:hypothetical protein
VYEHNYKHNCDADTSLLQELPRLTGKEVTSTLAA